MGFIYKITNRVNGKIYIGQTMKTVEGRFSEHIRTAKNKGTKNVYALHHAIRKHGADAFTVETLGEYPEDRLDEMEIYYIAKYNSFKPNGYNITEGGCGTRGYKHTEETRKFLTQNLYKRWNNMTPEEYEEACRKRSEALKGLPKSKEHRQKMSEIASQRTGEKNAFYGKTHTEETRRKIGEASKGRKSVRNIPIKCVKDGVSKEFNSYMEASLWLIANGYTKSKNRTSVTTTIKEGIECGGKRYGFNWYLV